MCHSTKHTSTPSHRPQSKSKSLLTNTLTSDTKVPEEYQQFSIQQEGIGSHTKPLTVLVTINGKPVTMEIDTGSSVSITSDSVFSSVFETATLQETEVKLCTYSGEQLPVKGKITCEVSYEGQTYTLPLIVLAGEGPTLLGRDWMQQIRLDWSTVFQIKAVQDGSLQPKPLLQPFEDIFKEELSTYTGDKAKIHIDTSLAPKFCKYQPLPYAIREMVEKELQGLETLGIIKPVKSSK